MYVHHLKVTSIVHILCWTRPPLAREETVPLDQRLSLPGTQLGLNLLLPPPLSTSTIFQVLTFVILYALVILISYIIDASSMTPSTSNSSACLQLQDNVVDLGELCGVESNNYTNRLHLRYSSDAPDRA